MLHADRLALVLVAAPLLFAGELQAQGRLDARVRPAVERHAAQALEYRHRIHSHPELGNREFETAKLVAAHLEELGFEVRTGIAHTGVVGVLKGGKPGPVVAVRADMDALPVTEDTDLPFRSTVRTSYNDTEVGVMHACGHDVHTAVQLGVASVLAELKADLPGTVVFVFQPAEEGPPAGEEGGAELMLKEGAFSSPRPEVAFGLHTLSDLPVGQVGYTPGPALAAVDQFKITLTGTQTHGAQPHQGVDPIVLGSQVVSAFQTIVARSLDPLQPAVVTVGMFHGGERFNIIPSQVRLEGTVRSYSSELQDAIERRMHEILGGLSAAAGANYELDYERITPATVNDRELTRRVLPTLEALLGDQLVELPPTMGGEDFAYFADAVPGFFYRLGTLAPGTTSGPHHSPTFRADDGSVAVGMRVMSNLIVDYLLSAAGR